MQGKKDAKKDQQPEVVSGVPKDENNKIRTSLLFVFGILIILLGLFSAFLFSQNQKLSKELSESKESITTPSPEPTEEPTIKGITLRTLQFIPPTDWWYKQGKNETLPIEWVDLNPQEAESKISVFTVRVDMEERTLQAKKNELIKMWKLVDIKEEVLTIGGVDGVLISGIIDPNEDHYNSRFQKNDKVNIALVVLEEEVYQFLGLVNEYEEEYYQTLSTFNFSSEEESFSSSVESFKP